MTYLVLADLDRSSVSSGPPQISIGSVIAKKSAKKFAEKSRFPRQIQRFFGMLLKFNEHASDGQDKVAQLDLYSMVQIQSRTCSCDRKSLEHVAANFFAMWSSVEKYGRPSKLER